jgi:hypothetical protein
MSIQQAYEIWAGVGGNSISVSTPEGIAQLKASAGLPSDARLLHRIVAATYEDAMQQRNKLMGWGDYKPEGPRIPCPNHCGGYYYPKGSGQCPNCGDIA